MSCGSTCACGPCQPGISQPGIITQGFLANTVVTRGFVPYATVTPPAAQVIRRGGSARRRQLQRIIVSASLVSVNGNYRDWDLSGHDAKQFTIDELKFPPKFTLGNFTTSTRLVNKIRVAARRIVGPRGDDGSDE